MQSIVVDSNDGPAGRRLAYWRELLQSVPYPLIDGVIADDENFRTSLRVRHIGETTVTRFSGSRQRVIRSRDAVEKRPTESLMLVALNSGAYEQSFDGHCFFSKPEIGDFALYDGDTPVTVDLEDRTIASFTLIPRAKFRPYLGEMAGMRPRLLRRGGELHELLTACLPIYAMMDAVPSEACAAALDVIVHLISMMLELDPSDSRDLGQSLAEARRRKALSVIDGRLDDPRLGPQLVADHLRISLRSLHELFRPTGETVATRIAAQRVARAKKLLLRHPQRTALEIGLACGFDSAATFYRSFGRATGMAPGEFRKRRP